MHNWISIITVYFKIRRNLTFLRGQWFYGQKTDFFSFSTKTFYRDTSYHWFVYKNVALRVICSNFGQIARSIRIRFQNLNFRSFWPLCHFSNFIKNTWYGARLKPNCMLNSAMSLEMHFMIILSILISMGSSGSVQPWPIFKNNQNLDFTRFHSIWPLWSDHVMGQK